MSSLIYNLIQYCWLLPDVSSLTVELEVSAAGSVVTDAQAVSSESASPLATDGDAALLDTTDVSDDDAEILWQKNKQNFIHLNT